MKKSWRSKILAIKSPVDRERTQLEIPQKVFEGFLRNKYPPLRFLKKIPDIVRLPSGEFFAVDTSKEKLVRSGRIGSPTSPEIVPVTATIRTTEPPAAPTTAPTPFRPG